MHWRSIGLGMEIGPPGSKGDRIEPKFGTRLAAGKFQGSGCKSGEHTATPPAGTSQPAMAATLAAPNKPSVVRPFIGSNWASLR
jgi:hypothetical protein